MGDENKASRGDENKRDHGKRMWDLLPLKQVGHIVDVLTFGAQEYGPNCWQKVDNGQGRYWAAMMRHLEEHQAGVRFDAKSKLPHLWHAACNILFLMWLMDEEAK